MMGSRFSRRQVRRPVAAGLSLLVAAGFSAHAGFASLNQMHPPAPARQPPVGYEADDHFPGALYFTAVPDEAAPAPGTTGTTALPNLPVPPGFALAAGSSITPAPPFRLAGTQSDRARALHCLTAAIYYEAASEPEEGQRAVAQTVLNRVRHPAFPATVCGVVFQGSEKRGCQFSFACDGALARRPAPAVWERARRVAAAALAGSVFAPVGLATHYHTYAVTPAWNRSLVMTGMFGAHLFHRWKGYWGTPSAFRQRYRGGEPLPELGRPTSIAAPITPAAAPLGANPAFELPASPPEPVRDSPPDNQIQPGHTESGAAVALPDSVILDRWKDSGKPLR